MLLFVKNLVKPCKEIFEKAGFPKGVFTFLKVSHTQVEEMIAHPIIRGVSLTGSEAAGRKIAETAGEKFKKMCFGIRRK